MREKEDTHVPTSLGRRHIRDLITAKVEILKIVGEHYDSSVSISMKVLTKSTTFRKILNFRIKLLQEEVGSVN